MRGRPPRSYTGQLVLLGLAYYLTARLSLRLALVNEVVTPIWPPTGIALVALLGFGRRVWPAVPLTATIETAVAQVRSGASQPSTTL